MAEQKISVVIPAYNEASNIISTLKDTVTYLKERFDDQWEIIIVDDGSQDTTRTLVEDFIREYPGVDEHVQLIIHGKNTGKGAAVRRGLAVASGSLQLFIDADNSTNIRELDKALVLFEQGADVVIGSRRREGSIIVQRQPWFRRFMSRVHHVLASCILFTHVTDYNCGFKIFTRKAANKLFSVQRINRWVFDDELIFLARKYKFTLKEIPIHWHHVDTSKVSTVKDAVGSVFKVLRIRMNDMRGLYTR